jgi:type VI secretion system secreted protein VgrG
MSSERTTRFGARIAIHGLVSAALLGAPTLGAAQTILGSAQHFAVLGASTVTNTGPTTIQGDLGVYPGTAMTGVGSITLIGTAHYGDAVAGQAQHDARGAFNAFAAMPFTSDLSGQNLGGMMLTPGVYFFSSSAQLTGMLALNFLGNATSNFVFQIGSALTTASGASVTVVNGAGGGNVFWQVGSSATLGTGTTFRGNVIADQSITLDQGSTIACGRAIALVGAVTMNNNIVSNVCRSGGPGGGPPDGPPIVTTPEPATLALLAPFALALAGVTRRARRAPLGTPVALLTT